MIKRLLFVILFVAVSADAFAATHYVRAGAGGTADGSDWTNAWTALPTGSGLTRGDTYFIADGSYAAYTFSKDVSGTTLITVKKATVADHGTETGWSDAYGDGQAVFTAPLSFTTSYWIFDGNGAHTVPSDSTNDYGFKVSADYGICGDPCNGTSGIVAFGSGTAVSNITLKYTHVYNTYNGNDGNVGAVSLRFYPTAGGAPTYIKVQNCFLENSGKDGIQISYARYVLIERSYVKKLGLAQGGSPDVHGQAVQLFYGGDDIIFRWNKFEANQGQALIAIAGINTVTERVRFYGNVVYNKTGEKTATYGFNTGGGIMGDAWSYNSQVGVYHYNNTVVNVGGDYSTGGSQWSVANLPMGTGGSEEYGYNNLFYNDGGTTGATGWTAWDYHASGACGNAGTSTYGGANEQTGLDNTIFSDYSNNDFTLASNTTGGLNLSGEAWWSSGADAFFGTLDSNVDILGNSRSTWSRGAYEYGTVLDSTPSAFSFTDVTNAALSTLTTTDPCATVAGIDAGQTPAITITGAGCTYNVDGGAYTGDAGTVGLDNVVCLRGTSSGSYSTTYPSCTLTIGGVNNTGAPWTVRTLDAVSDPVAPRMRAGSMSGGWR